MISFSAALILLILGYVIYGSLAARIFGEDPKRPTPVQTMADGVDYVRLRKELLLREGGSGAGHALHLIDGAAGMAKAPAAHLGDLHAAGCDDGALTVRLFPTGAAQMTA